MRKLPLLLLLAGCGNVDNTAPFLGAWKNTGGSSVTTCPGAAPQTATFAANSFTSTITKSGNNTLAIVNSDPSGNACNLTATVISNTTASFTVGASCALGGVTITAKSGSIVVGAGVTAEMTLDASLVGGGMNCDETFDIPLIQ
jgi:hypothetical protein